MDSQTTQDNTNTGGSNLVRGIGKLDICDFSSLDDNVLIDFGCSGKGVIKVGFRSKIKFGCILRCYENTINVGDRVSIGEYCVLSGHGGISIGKHSIIASHCVINAASHIFDGNTPIRFQGETAFGINIGEDVWLGAHVTVLDGVTIGDGCIVGAGSVVTRSLPGNTICFGTPCRVQRKRECKEMYRYESAC